jgi:hypothetical protein
MKQLFVAFCLLLAVCCNVAAQELHYAVSGLEKEAEIIVDEWGVPHIYANTHYDAFFVQGFNAARDRLWQIDLWRRRGLGKLSEVFGADYVEQDRATRLFLYRGDMYREWLAYGSDAKQIAEAFTSGRTSCASGVTASSEMQATKSGVHESRVWLISTLQQSGNNSSHNGPRKSRTVSTPVSFQPTYSGPIHWPDPEFHSQCRRSHHSTRTSGLRTGRTAATTGSSRHRERRPDVQFLRMIRIVNTRCHRCVISLISSRPD